MMLHLVIIYASEINTEFKFKVNYGSEERWKNAFKKSQKFWLFWHFDSKCPLRPSSANQKSLIKFLLRNSKFLIGGFDK